MKSMQIKGIENPRVGGSIPSLGTTKTGFLAGFGYRRESTESTECRSVHGARYTGGTRAPRPKAVTVALQGAITGGSEASRHRSPTRMALPSDPSLKPSETAPSARGQRTRAGFLGIRRILNPPPSSKYELFSEKRRFATSAKSVLFTWSVAFSELCRTTQGWGAS